MLSPFDYSGLEAKLAGAYRRNVTARPGADHQYVIVGHSVALLMHRNDPDSKYSIQIICKVHGQTMENAIHRKCLWHIEALSMVDGAEPYTEVGCNRSTGRLMKQGRAVPMRRDWPH